MFFFLCWLDWLLSTASEWIDSPNFADAWSASSASSQRNSIYQQSYCKRVVMSQALPSPLTSLRSTICCLWPTTTAYHSNNLPKHLTTSSVSCWYHEPTPPMSHSSLSSLWSSSNCWECYPKTSTIPFILRSYSGDCTTHCIPSNCLRWCSNSGFIEGGCSYPFYENQSLCSDVYLQQYSIQLAPTTASMSSLWNSHTLHSERHYQFGFLNARCCSSASRLPTDQYPLPKEISELCRCTLETTLRIRFS